MDEEPYIATDIEGRCLTAFALREKAICYALQFTAGATDLEDTDLIEIATTIENYLKGTSND